jgi:hypothetical protein
MATHSSLTASSSPECAAPALFHPAVRKLFTVSFAAPTAPQIQGWPAIAKGDSTLSLAPTRLQRMREARREVNAAMAEAKKHAPLFAGQVALIRIHSSYHRSIHSSRKSGEAVCLSTS